jgi:hypothetical protein
MQNVIILIVAILSVMALTLLLMLRPKRIFQKFSTISVVMYGGIILIGIMVSVITHGATIVVIVQA